MSNYTRGILLVLTAGACWSIGGIMLRNMEAADGWQVLFWRAVGMTVTILLIMVLRHGRRVVPVFRAAGRAGIVGGLCLASGFTSNIFAMLNTTVANTLFMQSTQVFFAAVLAWILLRERVRRATWIAMVVAFVGVAVMMGDGLAQDALLGNLLGLGTGVVMAGFAIALRFGRDGDMLPAACLAGVFSALAGAAMAETLVVTTHDLLLALAMGVIQFGLGFTLFTFGSRHVPAAELMLVALTEVLLAPIWVWIGVGERASVATLIGGALLMAAIAGLALSGMRRRVPRKAAGVS